MDFLKKKNSSLFFQQDMITLSHSSMVAKAAYEIAKRTLQLNPHEAYECGLFHDFGKFYLKKEESYKHPFLGYRLMKKAKKQYLAEICLAHPFPIFEEKDYILYYCHGDLVEAQNIQRVLSKIQPHLMIKLIQFCDKISGIDTYITLDQKFSWYLENYNIKEKLIDNNYKAYIKIKKNLDTIINDDIYKVLKII